MPPEKWTMVRKLVHYTFQILSQLLFTTLSHCYERVVKDTKSSDNKMQVHK